MNNSDKIKIFYSYSHSDEAMRKKLDDHLAFLKHDSIITWYDREIIAGTLLNNEIQKELNEADIILLLVSSSFLSSFYCYDVEMKRAMEKHDLSEAIVVPILLSDCVWQRAPFAKLLITPYDAKSIDNPNNWPTIDAAFTIVAQGLEKTVDLVKKKKLLQNNNSSSVLVSSNISDNKLSDYPKPRPYFTGREKEIEDFKQAINEENPLILIDGPGGIGKTQFVSRCIENYIEKNKIIWYNCTAASQLDTLISESGYPELLKGNSRTDRGKFSAFKDKIQENGLFLFLDNFQETNSNPIFLDFLIFIQEYLKKGCIVVIDRDDIRSINLTPKRIHIEGFKEKKLEYAKALIDHSYKDDVQVNDSELEKLCEQLKGYPLAIDLAIYLLSQGDTPSDVITKIIHEVNAEDFSERLLNAIFSRPDALKEEKDFIRQFSVFTGTVPEEAVLAVISEDVIKIAQKKLQKKNLLYYSNGHYEIHPLVRELCYKELEEKEIVHETVAKYYISKRTNQLNPKLEENIFYHLLSAKKIETIADSIENTGRQFIQQGQLDLLNEFITKLKMSNVSRPIFDILSGDILQIKGDWGKAIKYFENACKSNVVNIKAEGIVKCGEIFYRQGDVKDALPYFERCLEFSKKNLLRKEEARSLNDIGLVHFDYEKYDLALKEFSSSLKIRIEINDIEDISTSYNNLGTLFDAKNQYNKAFENYSKSLKIAEDSENKNMLALYLGNIAGVLRKQNKLTEAFEKATSALKISEEIGDKAYIAFNLNTIGMILVEQHKFGDGLYKFNESLKVKEEIGDKRGIAVSYINIGAFYLENEKNYDKALIYFFKSLALNRKLGIKNPVKENLYWISKINHILGIDKFKEIALRVYNILDLETQKSINLKEIFNEPQTRESPKIGRNDPCPCGNGKKYKNCHGQNK
jgi:tetratricopeptide (TPR) repeat protein